MGAPRVCGDDPHQSPAEQRQRRRAPRVCGDDPESDQDTIVNSNVLPAYAGMILLTPVHAATKATCSPRMRG